MGTSEMCKVAVGNVEKWDLAFAITIPIWESDAYLLYIEKIWVRTDIGEVCDLKVLLSKRN